ncbi:hypothetical protein [Burkholderia pseudomallei]|uniref:hypothetical protein n=1 Tax=Burkholderia pseudomallei TaxID=28450 RepID=UPI000A794223|nr:hypothetical protein [Burkholderia pseudomallei]
MKVRAWCTLQGDQATKSASHKREVSIVKSVWPNYWETFTFSANERCFALSWRWFQGDA